MKLGDGLQSKPYKPQFEFQCNLLSVHRLENKTTRQNIFVKVKSLIIFAKWLVTWTLGVNL